MTSVRTSGATPGDASWARISLHSATQRWQMYTSDGPATRRTSPCFLPQNEHRRTGRSTFPIISEHFLDRDGHGPGDPLDGHQVVNGRASDVVDAAELANECPAADRAESADAVQGGGEGVFLPDDAMKGDRKSMRL